ncbi:P-loop NTPase fold protein [Photobacterium phosphoreum]|uniref:KAP family P-loop NTPase fold protein n=1 Tax=Photobacterium phosphoreum TaxID=659 RepID=UPI0039AEC32D
MDGHNYLSDSPVSLKVEDQFSRRGFSERVAQVISRRSDPSSLVIGLYGAWGDGKSSVLNFIEESLENDDNVVCIRFNPWRFGSEDELLKGFFFDIAEVLDKKIISKTDTAKDLFKSALGVAGSVCGASGVESLAGKYISSANIDEFKSRIEALLEDTKKRVLIIVDDVDRLDKSEIYTLFRIVKLTANFKYTSYVLAFDKDVVISSLQERYSSGLSNAGESFLEKIIQVPLHLPVIEKGVLVNFCFTDLNEALSVSEITLTEKQAKEFGRYFSNAFGECLTTPRKAKLYGNTLLFSLPILKGEVNPVDLMFVEAIRIFTPDLYDAIKNNKELFTGVFSNSSYSDYNPTKERIKKIISDGISKNKNINEKQFVDFLSFLFPKLGSVYSNLSYSSEYHQIWERDQRVCSDKYFSRYFTYSIPSGDVADQIISEVISRCENFNDESKDDDFSFLTSCFNTNTCESVIRKLRGRSKDISSKASSTLSLFISENSENYSDSNGIFDFLSPFSTAAILISDLISNLDEDERKSLICLCIDLSPSIKFKMEIFKWLRKENDDNSKCFDIKINVVNEIGLNLANSISSLICKNSPIMNIEPKSLHSALYFINEYGSLSSVSSYIKSELYRDKSAVFFIINSFVPTSWNLETGLSLQSDFEQKEYNEIIKYIDPIMLMDSINIHFPDLVITDEYPESDYQEKRDELLIVMQFIWLHKHFILEAEAEVEAEAEADDL